MIARRMAFRSFVEYAASARHAALDVQILSREERPWRLDRCRLGDVLLEHGVEGAPHVATVSPARGGVCFYFSAGPGGGRSLDSRDVDEAGLCRLAGGSSASLVVRRPGEWFAVAASAAVASSVASTLGQDPLPDLSSPAVLRVPPERLARLREQAFLALQGSEGREATAADAPASLGRSLLGEALRASAAATPAPPPASHARIGRRSVLDRLDDVFSRRASESLYVADLCEATGLPERTLRYIVAEQYGTSPVRLLRNRRLCQLHRALLAAADTEQSVAAIAARCGFRHMGQLAADYRALFGELPSATLRRARDGETLEAGPAAAVPPVEPASELLQTA